MREITSKIAYLESNQIESVSKKILLKEYMWGDMYAIFINSLLRVIFGDKDGIVYFFPFANKILGDRVLLEILKEKGFVQNYGEGLLHCDYPRFNFFGMHILIDKDTSTLRSWGYTLPFEDKTLALKKALGEALERQATYYHKKSSSVFYPKLLKNDASFLYSLMPKFSEKQLLQYSNFAGSSDDFKNVTGFYSNSLTKKGKTFLPLHCFYWGEYVDTSDKIFYEGSTSGSGGGVTVEDATLSALYELIERDLFMLYWYSKVKPSIITVDDESGEFFDYIRDVKERFNLEVYFLNLEYDINVPACLCLVVDPVLHLVAIGAKVTFSSEVGMRGAFLEALATLNLIRTRKEQVGEDRLKELLQLPAFIDPTITKNVRVGMYCSPFGISIIKNLWIEGNKQKISFVEYNKKTQVFPSRKEELAKVVIAFKGLVKEKGEGYHIYEHHFSSIFTKFCKYKVVHVFVPSFLKLHLFEPHAAPISSRLMEFAKSKGIRITKVEEVNQMPHLFP